uniref:Uncharacterized protein n=1 Tax=Triticum urartu TaxID=4572 RepID=A0A8R7QK48_TRIUA
PTTQTYVHHRSPERYGPSFPTISTFAYTRSTWMKEQTEELPVDLFCMRYITQKF